MHTKIQHILFPSCSHTAITMVLALILGTATALGSLLYFNEGGGKLEIASYLSINNLLYCSAVCFGLFSMGLSG